MNKFQFIWETQSGEKIEARQMSRDHLINAVTWLVVVSGLNPNDKVDGHTMWDWVQHMSWLIINKSEG